MLIKKLGRQTCTFTSEYKHYIWLRNIEGYNYFILSGKRGTDIEIDQNMPDDLIVQVLNELLETVTEK